MKLLTYCIPTYNRKQKALLSCERIIKQIEKFNLQDYVDVLLSDNCSPDLTCDFLHKNLTSFPAYLKIVRQETNLGLVGNVNFLFNNSNSEYVWIVGDDDLIEDGAIKHLLQEIENSRRSFYLLNFKCEVNGVVGEDYFIKKDLPEDLYKDGTTGGFGLISNEVFNKIDFEKLFQLDTSGDEILMYPMARTFYGLFVLNGSILYDKIFLLHHAGDYSWMNKYNEVQSIYSWMAIHNLLKPLVHKEKFKSLLKLHTDTQIFRVSSFFYIVKSRDIKFIHKLFIHNLLFKVCIAGVRSVINAKYNKAIERNKK